MSPLLNIPAIHPDRFAIAYTEEASRLACGSGMIGDVPLMRLQTDPALLWLPALWPLAVYVAAVILLVTGMLAVSYLLGQRHQARATGEPYESGIVSTGSARMRFSVQFYLIAMLFVIFDLEAVFIFAWAIAARETGWTGYVGVLVFIGALAAALIYESRIGAFDWGSKRRKFRQAGDRS